jgi:uncharacterized BrkB/YihY/UPF0761 family membrane protein
MLGWLDKVQQRSRAARFALAVVYKYLDDQGGYLAALITYYAFVSLFPLLLLLTTTLGILLVGHPGLQQDVLQSTLRQFPISGTNLNNRTNCPVAPSPSWWEPREPSTAAWE